MALDVSGNWDAGDDFRLLEALQMQFSEYSLDCLQACMNQMEDISPEAVLQVKGVLTDYDTASAAVSAQNLANLEGKTLVQADVLKWERNGNGPTGAQSELGSARKKLMNYFAFCPCTPEIAFWGGITQLVHS
jgi:hypothetical protein